jgi:rod shape determining protein RodA
LLLINKAVPENPEWHLFVQSLAIVLGVGAFVVFSFVDFAALTARWRLCFLAGILLICLLFPFGTGLETTGNNSWIRFGLIGLTTGFQPAEVAKLLYILSLAGQIAELGERVSSTKGVLMLLLNGATAPIVIILASKDYGMALSFLVIFMVSLFAAGVRIRYFAGFAAGCAALSPVIWNNLLLERHRERIISVFKPESDPLGAGFQVIRSKAAIAAGGLLGHSLPDDAARYANLPARHTDFIFSVACEEFGFSGGIAILALLLFIILRILLNSARAKTSAGRIACAAAASAFMFQTFATIGMCVGLTPVIGITLPFFSYGGTSVVASFMMLGLCSIYKNGRDNRYAAK